ncbi:MAG TPA: class II aldolase/adducin family protein, partial [Pseudolabrys sp.]
PEEGASLAKALGPSWIVLMRRHGATTAGTTLEELTFRTIYTARNAAVQIEAHNLGHVSPLTAAETEMAGEYNLRPGPVARAWEYWSARLDKAEGNWKPAKSKTAAAKPKAAAKKPAAKKSAAKKKKSRR